MTSPVNAKIQHVLNQKDVQMVHVDRLRQFTENDPFNTFVGPPTHSSEAAYRSVSDSKQSNNNGASMPVTLPEKPGTLDDSAIDDVVDHGVLARLEEDWRVHNPAKPEVPQADHLRRYDLRPRANLRPPDKYDT